MQAKRRRYRAKVRRIEAKRLVFVDETGVNTAMTPTHAWARRGERAEGSVPSSCGSTTVIAALGLDGVRAPLIFPGATDTQAIPDLCESGAGPGTPPGGRGGLRQPQSPPLSARGGADRAFPDDRPAPAAVRSDYDPTEVAPVARPRDSFPGRIAYLINFMRVACVTVRASKKPTSLSMSGRR